MAENNSPECSSLRDKLDLVSSLLTVGFKAGAMIGGLCFFFYCLRIHHFPTGVTLGDGMLLLLLATCWFMVYGLFLFALYSLGACFNPVMRAAGMAIRWFRSTRGARNHEPLDLPQVGLFEGLGAALALLVILGVSHDDPAAIWELPFTSLMLALMFAALRRTTAAIKRETDKKNRSLAVEEKVSALSLKELHRLRLGMVIFILVMPLLVGGISGFLLDQGMSLAAVRRANSIILLSSSVSDLVPSRFKVAGPAIPGFVAFKGIGVALRGIGTTTVIEVPVDGRSRYLEFPSEDVLVEPAL